MRFKTWDEWPVGVRFLLLLFLSVTGLTGSVVPAISQTNFERVFEDPVVPNGSAGSWDETLVGYHCLLQVGDTWHLYFTGDQGAGIGHATSLDGFEWTKDVEANPALVPGLYGSWDDTAVLCPYVIHDGQQFHMWYSGKSAWSGLGTEAIGYATSPDGVEWTKDDANNPVLAPGSPGSFDEEWASPCCVLNIGGTFRMWYGAVGNNVGTIGYAESDDGINWTKNPDPVFEPTYPVDCFDRNHVHFADVHFNGDSFEMWYAGIDGISEDRIGFATSPDGLSWQRYSCDPIFDVGEPGAWDDDEVYTPRVLVLPSEYRLYYTGVSGGMKQIGCAVDNTISPVNDLDGGPLSLMVRPSLYGAHPNPFNPQTTIAFELPWNMAVRLAVYDLSGRLVVVLLDDNISSRGRNEVVWQGQDSQGRALASGVYFYRLEAGGYVETRRMTLLK